MIKKILLYIAIILVSVQIIGASSQVATESAEISGKITKKVVTIITSVKKVEVKEMDSLYNTVHHLIRKTAHFAEYMLLSFLVFLLSKSYNLKNSICVLISLGYCLAFASVDEIYQLSVEGRSGEFKDVMIDFCGSIMGNIFGAGIYYIVEKVKTT